MHSLASLDGEWVEAEGQVQPPNALHAPLTGLPCVLYLVELTPWQRLAEYVTLYRQNPHREIGGAPFHLELVDGMQVLVDASQARLTLRSTVRRRVRLGVDPELDARLHQLYRRLGRRGPRRDTVDCRERSLWVGQQVQRSGWLVRCPTASGELVAGYRGAPMQWRLLATQLRA